VVVYAKNLESLRNPTLFEIEYLPNKPDISRIKGSGGQSITELLWRKVGLGGLFLVFLLSFGFYFVRHAIKEFKRSMDLESIKDILHEWASKDSDIRSVYIYGSRARGYYGENSDLDIAITLERKGGKINGYGLWVKTFEEYIRQVESLLPEMKIHLEYLDIEEYLDVEPLGIDGTPTVKAAVEESGILIYSRE